MSTLSLCLISNDDESNIRQCMESVKGCWDQLVIVDTGMDDAARKACISYGADLHQFNPQTHPRAFFHDTEAECSKFGAPGPFSNQWALGDFAAARNESFKHATCDYVAWIDSDDVLEGAEHLRNIIADMDARKLDMAFLSYNYASDHLGRVFYRQWRERVFRRGAASWANPVHEVLMPTKQPVAMARYDQPVYNHRRKPTRKGIDNRNYKILLRQAWQLKTEKPTEQLDPRILFYLGQEARFIDPKRAVGFYEEYLQSSGWPEERAAAHVAIGTLIELGTLGMPPLQAYAQADREYATAAAEMPENPDGVFGLARIAYLRGRWADCVRYTETGLKIGNTDSMLGANPVDRTYRPHIYYNHALAKLGRLEEAIKSCEAGLAAFPDDPGVPGGAPGMLKFNLDAYRKDLAIRTQPQEKAPMVTFDKNEDVDAPPAHGIPRDAMVIWAMQLWKQNVANGDHEKARKLLEALPSTIVADPVIDRMFQSTARRFSGVTVPLPKKTGGLDIVLWTGPAPEPWDPSTPNTKGLGGSETAAIEMARELTKLGHRVVVYAEATGTFDGVEYRHHSAFRGCACDVFIASRAPGVADAPINAGLKLLWVHDIHCGEPTPQMERWLYWFDRVLCLSNWHKQFFCSTYRTLHPDRVIVTRNGIDPARFATELPKRNQMVFSSSPNRGLDTLLANFPHIRNQVPDAELHIYYGFDTWETIAKMRGAHDELAAIEKFKAMINQAVSENRGIFWHGKQPQSVVAEAYLRSKVWGYLTGFSETSCITAMEAMAAGAVPVCSALAALPETVKHGKLIDLDDPRHAEKWLREVIKLMREEAYRAPIAKEARAYALNNLSWAGVAKDWSEMFGVLSTEVAGSPIPLWKAA